MSWLAQAGQIILDWGRPCHCCCLADVVAVEAVSVGKTLAPLVVWVLLIDGSSTLAFGEGQEELFSSFTDNPCALANILLA